MGPYKRLLWATISEMPQKYHTVKALALLCTWPMPSTWKISGKNSNETIGSGLGLSEIDPTFMLSGIMVQVAMQTGLHKASHTQEFFRQTRNIAQAEVDDRQLTWVLCNIVSQRFVTVVHSSVSTIEFVSFTIFIQYFVS